MTIILTCLTFSFCSFLCALLLSKLFAHGLRTKFEKNMTSRKKLEFKLRKKFQLQAKIAKIDKEAHAKILKARGRRKVLDSNTIEKVERVLEERKCKIMYIKGEKYQRCISPRATPNASRKRKSKSLAKTSLRRIFSLKIT